MKIEQGEVCKVDLGFSGKVRYMVAVSRTDEDPPRALELCAPITTKYRESRYEVEIGKPKFLREPSYVNLQGIVPVQWKDIIDKVCRIEPSKMEEIKNAIKHTFAI